MSDCGYPVLFALFVWWFSTGAIVYLDGLPRRTFRWTMAGATVLLGAGLCAIAASATATTVAGAYVAFLAAVVIWGWQEIAFLMGFLTGPRRERCPDGARGWQRLVCAIQTIIYHELAILLAAGAIVALTWDAPNQVGTWTFLILWVMRLSAKLNVFLGVPNLAEDFLPDHLRYLRSYFRRQPMNLLFPVSVTVATVVAALLVETLLTAPSGFEAVGLSLVTTLLVLAIVEHWMLVLPLSETALWRWALEARDASRRRTDTRTEMAWLEPAIAGGPTLAPAGRRVIGPDATHPLRGGTARPRPPLSIPRRQP